MDSQEPYIRLEGTDVFYTHDEHSAYQVTEGTARVFIVPWNPETQTAGRRATLCDVECGRVIPAFAFRDMEYAHWRFAIVPKENALVLKAMEGCCTEVLKTKFLSRTGVQNAAKEGYALSLREHYRAMTLKADVFSERVKKDEPKVAEASAEAIQKALAEDTVAVVETSRSELYQITAYACKKSGIRIETERTLTARCGRHLTVPKIAEQCHFICRDVVLDELWYTKDCGVLISTIHRKPVACIPRRDGTYLLHHADDTPDELVTKERAAEISPTAFSIGRSLPEKSMTRKDLFRFCCKSVRMWEVGWLFVLGVVGALIGVLLPTLHQLVYDEYIPIGHYGMLVQTGILIVCFLLGGLLFSLVQRLTEYRISSRVSYDLQNAMYHRIFRLPESFFRRFDSADLTERLMRFGPIAGSLTTKIITSGFALLFSIVYLVRMCSYSGTLSVIALGMLLVVSLVLLGINVRMLVYQRRIISKSAEADSKLCQYLTAEDKIRMAGAEERALYEYMRPFSQMQRQAIGRSRFAAAQSQLKEAAPYLFAMVFYAVIVRRELPLTTGAFLGFQSAFGLLSAAAMRLVQDVLDVVTMKADFERLRPIVEEAAEDDDDKEYITELGGSITLEHLTFSYSEGGRNVLNDISTKIKAGEYVAIVGPSGCGKSTLLKLMLGFEKPKTGKIYYDRKDLDTLNLHSLRKRLGVVLQNGKLISGSIYDNITITADHPTMQEVEAVVDAVGLKEDIDEMPMGIHTILSESGSTVSGGQQQRILIARSIMNRPRVLFFDEATSALDNLSQAKVCKSLERMHMTRIVIAHRLSTVKNCDRILVIQNGELVEEGNYETLMRNGGLFYQMASRQLTEN